MSRIDVLPDSFLALCAQYYEQIGVVSRLAEPTDDSPFYSCIVRFDDIGERGTMVDLELCFIPGLEPLIKGGVYMMQAFATILEPVLLEHQEELRKATARVNMTLPLGAFGLYEESGTLYFKHNTMLHRQWLMDESTVKKIDIQNGFILSELHRYAEQLTDVAEGRKAAGDVE